MIIHTSIYTKSRLIRRFAVSVDFEVAELAVWKGAIFVIKRAFRTKMGYENWSFEVEMLIADEW